jgi:hypothetical protein
MYKNKTDAFSMVCVQLSRWAEDKQVQLKMPGPTKKDIVPAHEGGEDGGSPK